MREKERKREREREKETEGGRGREITVHAIRVSLLSVPLCLH